MKILKSLTVLLLSIVPALLLAPSIGAAQPRVEITRKPQGLVQGELLLPVSTSEEIAKVELFINGVKQGERVGRSVVFPINVGGYIRRLRIKVAGLDASGLVVAEDEAVVNDPQPPFRVRLRAPAALPEQGTAELTAGVIAPANLVLRGVEFFMGEVSLGTDASPPFSATFEVAKFPDPLYARVVARAYSGEEANDVFFWGSAPRSQVDVLLQQIPLSVAGTDRRPVTKDDLTLIDTGAKREINSVISASDLPLNVILLLDVSESMIEEVDVVKRAARGFAESLLRPGDRMAVAAFNDRLFWVTGFMNDPPAVERGVGRLKAEGATHLYDSVISMLYELQKMPGRRALVVVTDGMNQGGKFTLDHLVHYARYAGVPVYPIVKNRFLTRMMRFGFGAVQANRFAAIARDSGATYFIIQKESELNGVYRKIAEELKQQYLVTFYGEGTVQDGWHPLVLESKSKRSLRIPRGYFP